MNNAKLIQKKENYIALAKMYLDEARDYLHEHCDNWDNSNEQWYVKLVHESEYMLIKAMTIDEVLNG